jgi:hypothetical protein
LEDDSYRLFLCALCRQQVKLCRPCDRGDIYCSKDCAAKRRCASVKRARRKYQKTFRGRLLHAARQQAYSDREKLKLTDQGSPEPNSDVIVGKAQEEILSRPKLAQVTNSSGKVTCDSCGGWCGPFARLDSLFKKGHTNGIGGKDDSKQRDRSRGSPLTLR